LGGRVIGGRLCLRLEDPDTVELVQGLVPATERLARAQPNGSRNVGPAHREPYKVIAGVDAHIEGSSDLQPPQLSRAIEVIGEEEVGPSWAPRVARRGDRGEAAVS
jgi:hypothetical protein